MTITRIENVPETWDDDSELPFFRLVERVFSATFLYGASVMLTSSDADDREAELPSGADVDAKVAAFRR